MDHCVASRPATNQPMKILYISFPFFHEFFTVSFLQIFKLQEERRRLEQRNRELELEQHRMNRHLLDLEEQQFQDYARQVIDHEAKSGGNLYPILKAARAGAGGGQGPALAERGAIRPSYPTADSTGAELPCFQTEKTEEVKRDIDCDEMTAKRLGFVW